MFKGQFGTPNFLLAEVNMLPELGYGIQRGVVLKTKSADLERKCWREERWSSVISGEGA